jgi:hypothetical protein
MNSVARHELTIAAATSMVYSTAISVDGRSVASAEVQNQAAAAVNDFVVQRKDHPNGEYYTVLGATEFAAGPGGDLQFVSSTLPSATPAAGKTHLRFDIRGAMEVRYGAKLATGTGNVIVRGGIF